MTSTPADAARRHRRPDHDIDAIFYERWAPRAMSGEPVTRAELDRVFEAARWAPSSYNRYGAEEELPEKYRAREAPRDRHPIDTFVQHGPFDGKRHS